MRNENFHVFSSASEHRTRDFLNQFQRVRGFFAQSTGTVPTEPAPVTVMIFGTATEFQPYRPNGFAAAYYTTKADHDFIVVGETTWQSSQAATHEYTHLVFRRAGFSLPPWLNEGLADFFSTLRPYGADTEFGDIMPARLEALNNEPWVPMEIILAADQKSPYYNEESKAGALYNQGWALVHMLMTKDPYRSRFWEVIQAIDHGTPSVQVLEKVYGMPFSQLETALRSYVSGDYFKKYRVKVKLDDKEDLSGQPADMFDVREVQAELLMGRRNTLEESRAQFAELAHEAPGRPEPWVALGYLAWDNDQPGVAEEHFAKAFELGDRNSRLLSDYASLASDNHPEASAAAFKALLERDPKNLNARLTLARLQLDQKQYAEALATAGPITQVRTAEQRDSLLYLRAYASLQLGDMATARARAQELKNLSTSGDDQARAEEILRAASPH